MTKILKMQLVILPIIFSINKNYQVKNLLSIKKDSILSLCDLSSEKSILEIKNSSPILSENEKGILKNLNINFIINLIIEKHI